MESGRGTGSPESAGNTTDTRIHGSIVGGAGRYAPSPSGDLHLGNLRTAMLAWLCARASNRAFLMRIEDLDRARDAGAAQRQLFDLRALGLDWDGEPVIQSERARAHEAAIELLRDAGLVYECTCSRREILEAPSAPHAPPGAYPGTCRDRSDDERTAAQAEIAPRLPALRLRTPDGAREASFSDRILGTVGGIVDDFVLRRGDGAVAYNLAVVVDDAAMGVDQVVRGDDLASSTPRQILLQQLLTLPTPEYLHVPLVLGPTGARLAKRDGAVTLRDLTESGISADRVRALLASSLGLAEKGEAVTMGQLRERFDLSRVPRDPWVYTG
ncbi:tRNA glutamyl-Q(34) synthetase GluQRS [Leucobacter sp. W1478]|uniref:tRNA glutamyl-Q(34) synthetase GluQRS n=1 Tax=Leucobacter sp. W1478 TaxID=3439065 RepID=UPI003F37395A